MSNNDLTEKAMDDCHGPSLSHNKEERKDRIKRQHDEIPFDEDDNVETDDRPKSKQPRLSSQEERNDCTNMRTLTSSSPYTPSMSSIRSRYDHWKS